MTLPATMRAWRVEQITEAGEMALRDVAVPQPWPDEYLVRVQAAGLARPAPMKAGTCTRAAQQSRR